MYIVHSNILSTNYFNLQDDISHGIRAIYTLEVPHFGVTITVSVKDNETTWKFIACTTMILIHEW